MRNDLAISNVRRPSPYRLSAQRRRSRRAPRPVGGPVTARQPAARRVAGVINVVFAWTLVPAGVALLWVCRRHAPTFAAALGFSSCSASRPRWPVRRLTCSCWSARSRASTRRARRSATASGTHRRWEPCCARVPALTARRPLRPRSSGRPAKWRCRLGHSRERHGITGAASREERSACRQNRGACCIRFVAPHARTRRRAGHVFTPPRDWLDPTAG